MKSSPTVLTALSNIKMREMSNGRKQAVSWRESGIAREKTRWREREGLGVGIKRAEPNRRFATEA